MVSFWLIIICLLKCLCTLQKIPWHSVHTMTAESQSLLFPSDRDEPNWGWWVTCCWAIGSQRGPVTVLVRSCKETEPTGDVAGAPGGSGREPGVLMSEGRRLDSPNSERSKCTLPLPFVLFRSPEDWMVSTYISKSVVTNTNLFWSHPHRHTQKNLSTSWASLNSVWSTHKINHYNT